VFKFIITGANMGAGVPCGAFIPMLAIGACIGAMLNMLWVELGMDPKYCDLLVMVCMSAFFTAIVKAPITGVVMVCELTWSFSYLLPVVIGVAIGYVIGDIARTDSIYEELLELFVVEQEIGKDDVRETFTLTVAEGALAEKRELRAVLWPAGVRVQELIRGGVSHIPDGETELQAGDVLIIVCTVKEPQSALEELKQILE
jgi:NhaP-type Na+/H+ and K+/H+ antiporter